MRGRKKEPQAFRFRESLRMEKGGYLASAFKRFLASLRRLCKIGSV